MFETRAGRTFPRELRKISACGIRLPVLPDNLNVDWLRYRRLTVRGPFKEHEQTMSTSEQRICPDCGSDRTALVQRGLAGLTDESDQYFRCLKCGRVTYEIISRTEREIRAGRISPGRSLRERGSLYTVRRVLKVGINEYLVYLRPEVEPGRDREPSVVRG